MIVIEVIGIVIFVVPALLVLAYFLQPGLLAFPYSWFISLFVRNPPFVDMEEHFPGHDLLRKNWNVVRSELERVLENEPDIPRFHEVDRTQGIISARDGIPWRTLIIKAYGKWVEGNAEKVPQTTALLKQLPQVTTAMFSILDAGKHIPPHVGFFKGVFRYHLALIVPDDGPVYIVVGGRKYEWIEGEDVLFDDTYWHTVYNRSSGRRVVLFCDVFREKNLPGWVRYSNRKMFDLLRNSRRLARAVEKAELARDIDGARDRARAR